MALAFMHVFGWPFKNAVDGFQAASVALGSNDGLLSFAAMLAIYPK